MPLQLAAVRGFTLIELMVTVTVMAVLLAIALPSFKSAIQNDTQATLANSLVYALNYARSEAVKRDAQVYLCPTANGQTCTTSTSTWTGLGWMVFTGSSSSPTRLQAWPSLPGNLTLVTKVSGTATTITPTFQPTGLTYATNGTVSGTSLITFNLCDSRGAAKAVAIELTPTGRAEVSQYPGYPVAGPSSTALTCP